MFLGRRSLIKTITQTAMINITTHFYRTWRFVCQSSVIAFFGNLFLVRVISYESMWKGYQNGIQNGAGSDLGAESSRRELCREASRGWHDTSNVKPYDELVSFPSNVYCHSRQKRLYIKRSPARRSRNIFNVESCSDKRRASNPDARLLDFYLGVTS